MANINIYEFVIRAAKNRTRKRHGKPINSQNRVHCQWYSYTNALNVSYREHLTRGSLGTSISSQLQTPSNLVCRPLFVNWPALRLACKRGIAFAGPGEDVTATVEVPVAVPEGGQPPYTVTPDANLHITVTGSIGDVFTTPFVVMDVRGFPVTCDVVITINPGETVDVLDSSKMHELHSTVIHIAAQPSHGYVSLVVTFVRSVGIQTCQKALIDNVRCVHRTVPTPNPAVAGSLFAIRFISSSY